MQIFLDISYNFGILIAISIIAGFIYQRMQNRIKIALIQGLLFGTAAIIGMLNPVIVSKGLIFDGRSVMISLAGLFYGPLAAAVSALMPAVLRIVQGGSGAGMGVSVITVSALIGIFFHYRWQARGKTINSLHLLTFGLIVHIAMLGCTFALPSEIIYSTLSKIWFSVLTAYPIAGIIIGRVLLDASDHWHIKKELENSEEKFRLLVKNSSDTIVIINEDGTQRYVSPSTERATGFTPAEVQGKSIPEIIHPEDIPKVMNLWQQLLADPTITLTARYRHIHKTKGWVNLEAVAQNYLAEPTVRGIVCSVRDITERIEAENSLQTEKERLLVTLRSIGDGVITTDTEGRIILLNSVAEMLTGWSQAEAEGQPLNTVFNIINENSGAACENPVTKVLQTGQTQELANHTMLISRNGEHRIIADSGAPIKDHKDVILGVVLVFRDMSEKQKLIEAAQQSQKLDSIGVLAGGIAHDFNNLLTGIFGYLSLARSRSTEEKIQELLDKSSAAIERARNLTTQLLTFAKGGDPVKRKIQLPVFIKDTVRFALSGSSVSAKFEIISDLYTAEIDRNQIAQVIDNLVINAKEAMPGGGIITVKAINHTIGRNEHTLLKPGKYIEIAIIDQGIGIPKEIISRIFDPFFTTKSRGHGLGLAMSYSIIRKHEGLLEASSEPGKGSQFTIYLPAVAQSNAETAVSNKPAEYKGSGRILIMDDEEMIREIVSEILSAIGFETVSVPDGKLAVEAYLNDKAAGRPFKAVIFDLTVPGAMGGREALEIIRQQDSAVKAFVSSGYSKDPVVANPAEYGFIASISKPYNIDELGSVLQKHL